MDNILVFDIAGKFAHFRKFYTNSSSLTYEIPPRTVIMGMLGSILELERDTYYETFSPDKCKMSISLKSKIKKHFECMNYLSGDNKNPRTQIRFELLLPDEKEITGRIRYRIFLWHKQKEIIEKIKNLLENNFTGYGIYLGQRQFRAELTGGVYLSRADYIKGPVSDSISTLTWDKNIIDLDLSDDADIVSMKILSNYIKSHSGREPKNICSIIFRTNGNLKGSFKELIKVEVNKEQETIAFYTPFKLNE